MKQNKLISFNNDAPTSWLTLIIIVVAFILFISKVQAYEVPQITVIEVAEAAKAEPREVQIITSSQHAIEEQKRAVLADLRHCESSGYNYAIGDNGASVGPFQWQKPTFEDKIGHKVSYEYYYEYVTDYKRIVLLTEEVFFNQGEWWRWENCSYKIGYVQD